MGDSGGDFKLEELNDALKSSSTKKRTSFVNILYDKIINQDLPPDAQTVVLQFLFSTYPLYIDRASRQAVQRCLAVALRGQSGPAHYTLLNAYLQAEAKKPNLAPASTFVLLEWSSIALQEAARQPQLWKDHGLQTTQSLARFLENFVASSSKESRIHSALVLSRRALRAVFKKAELCESAVKGSIQVLTAKASSPVPGNALLLGVIAGVAHRLPSARPHLEVSVADYHAFYTREIVGSRTVLPNSIADGLRDFFSSFETSEALQKDIIPSLEKTLLRAPEVVLNDLISPLIKSLPQRIDLSDSLKNHLLKPILSGVKSSNQSIREGSYTALKAILSHCRDANALQDVSDEILKNLKDAKVADHRSLYALMLAAIDPSETSVSKGANDLTTVASKEANELALSSEIKAMGRRIACALSQGKSVDAATAKLFTQGLNDKKPSVRRLWALELGNILWSLKSRGASDSIAGFAKSNLDALKTSWDEALANPVPSASSGLAAIVYVVAALALETNITSFAPSSLKEAARKQFASPEAKTSLLLNHRVYSKFTSEDDLRWVFRALAAYTHDGLESSPASDTQWAQAMIFTMVSSTVPPNVRREASDTLKSCYLLRPRRTSSVITAGIWVWLRHVYNEERDTAAVAAQTGASNLFIVIRSICVASAKFEGAEEASIDAQMIDLLVLCRGTLLPRVTWIELCLKTGADPRSIVEKNSESCLGQVLEHTNHRSDSFAQLEHEAACDTAAELAFVAPDAFTPLLVDLIRSDLDPEQLQHIGPEEAAIFRTPEGVAFIDVLAQKDSRTAPDKKAKDYDTLKWEEELRAQIAQKQGKQRKLTPDEAAKVKAQLEKESRIRNEVSTIASKLRRGIGLVRSLAYGPPSEIEAWMGVAAHSLLGAIGNNAGLIVGDAPVEAYLALSTRLSPRLGAMQPSVGVATLRSQGVAQIPSAFQEELVGDLVTRVLYRLRFSSEQRPFDIVSMLYILPLVNQVLDAGGVGRTEEDERDEQVVLAIEFLSFHVDQFASLRLPRAATVSLVLRSMQKYSQHHRMLRDCLQGLSAAIAPEATAEEVAVFLRACIVPQAAVRLAALQAIDNDLELPENSFSVEIWLASHDQQEENAEVANTIWEENTLQTTPESTLEIVSYLESQDIQLRQAAASALAICVKQHQTEFKRILERLESVYVEKAKPRVPERDQYGMPRKMDLTDPWEARHGIALAFKNLSLVFVSSELVAFVRFLIERGPLADKSVRVRDEMVQAATEIVSTQGGSKVEEMLKIFEQTLDSPESASADQDKVNEAVIILYGALARHLKSGDPRIPAIVDRLLTTLSTPSETVQYAVASCLPPLVQGSSKNVPDYLRRVMDELLHAKKYASRRGAAYGLAGIIRGRGLLALRESRILSSLRVATEEKKDPNQRQGAFLAYELLSLMLGPVFEPYTIQIVPQLLVGFGDPTADVREACLDASKTCFASLSSFGVKQVLPTLLEGLEETQWRSKKGACDSLGAMAYLDPQQLAVSLPEIIPPLTNVLNDSHKEVRGAANRSLQRFGDVISNPEIKSLVGILLKALSDPTKHTDEALDALLKVNFVHYLDAPSLALVVRILERGLGDRSATKRKSSQIIGSLAHLTDRKDLISHLPLLVSGLRVAAVDPVPTTRATSSKALGSLVEKLGEDALPDLIPSLMATLKTDTGAGDRLGSAQALSEVLAGLGVGRLEETLPSILQNVSSPKPSVREGFMSMFIFLPACFGNSFANYLSKIIPPILSGLADEIESIRDTSLRAGRLLVKNFASRAIDLLLPELQRGLGDNNYRIRLSSVELVGDLLFNLTGISAKADEDEEPDESSGNAQQSLVEALGEEKRANILSALYISRCDTSGLVRTAAMSVWKALVATPRTLREITPTLTQVIIKRLASTNSEQKHIAGNALGELIRKAGDGVLSSLLPTLEEGLETSVDTDAKQGICIALRELISSASQESLEDYESKLVGVVRTALVDSNADVREAAAEAFDSLQRLFGKKVIDQILPNLLVLLRDESEADNALAALLTLLTEATRSNIILPNLLPTLLASPISAFNARALASLASVSGTAMTRRLSNILNSLLDNIVSCKDEDRLEALNAAFDAVMLSVDEYDGLNTLMSVMLALSKHDDHFKRQSADLHLAHFFEHADVDYSRYYQDLVRTLLISFDDRDSAVVKAAWTALSTLTSKIGKEDMESMVIPTRQVLSQVGVAGHNLPGFLLPKGINAILPIFLHGLVNGPPDHRIQSALAISEIIDKTSGDALKPFVTQITGPLIRIVSERSVEVKAAILVTLNHLLEKIPTFLKPFLPQLQRTFTKALADPSSDVLRMRAAKALGTLIVLTPRIDPLIGELVTGSKTSDTGVRNAMQKALFEVVSRVGANMNEASRNAVIGLIDEDSEDADEATMITNARLLGALIKNVSPEAASVIVKSRVLTSRLSKPSILALNAILLDSPESLTTAFGPETVSTICRGIGSSDQAICENSILAAGKYLLLESSNRTFEVTKPIFDAMLPVMQPGSAIDARRMALVVVRTLSRKANELVRPHLGSIVPPVFSGVRDLIIPIKLSAEAAFVGIFDVVEEEGAVFEKYLAGPGASLPANTKRSMQDYFKRVATRLAAQARERREAEGGQNGLGLSNDERDDEREIFSVGKVDLGEATFEG